MSTILATIEGNEGGTVRLYLGDDGDIWSIDDNDEHAATDTCRGVKTDAGARIVISRSWVAYWDLEWTGDGKPDIYGVAEVAAALGEDKRNTARRRSGGQMPEASAVLAMGPVWDAAVIEPWILDRILT